MKAEKYEHDIIVLILRLMGEDPDTFSPETARVMAKYIDKAKEVLEGRREI